MEGIGLVGSPKDRLARSGFYLSLVGGAMCAAFGILLLRWLISLLLFGVMIMLTALLQRMTYKTLASLLTVLFSVFYLVLWWFTTTGLSMTFDLQSAGAVVGAMMGILGGSISAVAIRTI
jgi:hypothetical protein